MSNLHDSIRVLKEYKTIHKKKLGFNLILNHNYYEIILVLIMEIRFFLLSIHRVYVFLCYNNIVQTATSHHTVY